MTNPKPYDIMEDTFCLYCQIQLDTAHALQEHVLVEHPGTYAAAAIRGRLPE